MRYKLVIFDFDGTLADSFPWFLSVFNEVADRFGFRRITDDEVEDVRGLGSRQILKHFDVPLWKLPMIARHMRKLIASDAHEIFLFEGVDRMLRELAARNVQLAIVSSNSEATIRRILGPDNAARIAYYECGASLFGKPALIRRVLKRSGVPREAALYVGDEVRDIEAAKAERVAAGAVSWGYAAPQALSALAPAEVFADVDDLIRKLA